MGLTSDKTNLFNTIAREVGLYGRQSKDSQGKGKKEGGKSGGGKSAAKKKSNQDKKSIEAMDYDDFKFLTLDENFKRPFFRYIPDRRTMQRLVHRVAEFKYDLDIELEEEEEEEE